jgi:peptidoglycan hydrolase-like protein with peptidoglycan-binding domain
MTEDFYLRFRLEPGMCGEDVRYLQEVLKASGFKDVPADGVFDADTTAAARELQIRQRVELFDSMTEAMRPLPNTTLHGGRDLSALLNSDDPRVKAPFVSSPEVFESKDAYERFLRSEPSPILDAAVVDWKLLSLHMEANGLDVPPGGAWPKIEDWRFENTHVPPPGSPYCAIADASGGMSTAISDLALYDDIRKQLPASIGDERVAEATLRAMQDGIKTPEQMQQVVLTNDRIFVVGTVPGFRGVVDLNQPPLSPNEIGTQVAALERPQQTEREQPQQARSGAMLV